jgi:hypothetical protein
MPRRSPRGSAARPLGGTQRTGLGCEAHCASECHYAAVLAAVLFNYVIGFPVLLASRWSYDLTYMSDVTRGQGRHHPRAAAPGPTAGRRPSAVAGGRRLRAAYREVSCFPVRPAAPGCAPGCHSSSGISSWPKSSNNGSASSWSRRARRRNDRRPEGCRARRLRVTHANHSAPCRLCRPRFSLCPLGRDAIGEGCAAIGAAPREGPGACRRSVVPDDWQVGGLRVSDLRRRQSGSE